MKDLKERYSKFADVEKHISALSVEKRYLSTLESDITRIANCIINIQGQIETAKKMQGTNESEINSLTEKAKQLLEKQKQIEEREKAVIHKLEIVTLS